MTSLNCLRVSVTASVTFDYDTTEQVYLAYLELKLPVDSQTGALDPMLRNKLVTVFDSPLVSTWGSRGNDRMSRKVTLADREYERLRINVSDYLGRERDKLQQTLRENDRVMTAIPVEPLRFDWDL